MTSTATILLRAVVSDGSADVQKFEPPEATIADVAGVNGKRETITLSAAFTALSPPTGATAVLMVFTSGAVTATLKGVTGDTGIRLQSGVLSTVPICLPIVAATSQIGILSDGAATVDVAWL